MTQKARVTLERSYTIGEVDKKIFGSFVEHLGRGIYNGIPVIILFLLFQKYFIAGMAAGGVKG